MTYQNLWDTAKAIPKKKKKKEEAMAMHVYIKDSKKMQINNHNDHSRLFLDCF